MHSADNHDPDQLPPSRSQQRRDALAILALGEQLASLSPARLQAIELPDDVRAQIAQVRRITAHGAHKRELAYLAKLMRRHSDEAFSGARAMLGEDRQRQRQDAAAQQRLEVLREALIDGGDEALGEFIDSHPDVDRQHLRTIIRKARSERARDKPPRASRELFRLLRESEKS